MRCEFSEFTYGFAVTHEMVEATKALLPGPPLLPSLGDEGLLGFDVRMDGLLGWTFMFQYKIPQLLVRKNAAEWSFWKSNYLRFHTRDSSDQHELLLALEDASIFNVVQYLCPMFATAYGLNQAFTSGSLEDRSLRLRPSEIGPGSHSVTFDGSGSYKIFSEPRSGVVSAEARTLRGSARLLQEQTGNPPEPLGATQFRRMSESILEVIARERGSSAREAVELVLSRREAAERTFQQPRPDARVAEELLHGLAAFSDLSTIARMVYGGQVVAVTAV